MSFTITCVCCGIIAFTFSFPELFSAMSQHLAGHAHSRHEPTEQPGNNISPPLLDTNSITSIIPPYTIRVNFIPLANPHYRPYWSSLIPRCLLPALMVVLCDGGFTWVLPMGSCAVSIFTRTAATSNFQQMYHNAVISENLMQFHSGFWGKNRQL